MTKELDDLTRQLDDAIADLERSINRNMPALLSGVYERILELTAQVAEARTAQDVVLGSRKITELRQQITQAVTNNPTYRDMLIDVATTFNQINVISGNYLSAAFVDIGLNQQLAATLTQQAIERTYSLLTGAGIDANFTAQTQNIINTWLSGNGTRAELNRLLRASIKGTGERKGFLERYIKQVSNDSVEQFNRAYLETLTSDLDVRYWFYSGTLIADSRPFCKARAGKAFTEAEVKRWGLLKSWSGRIPATDSNTIKVYLGGYNCRHRLIPVSKEVYEQINEG